MKVKSNLQNLLILMLDNSTSTYLLPFLPWAIRAAFLAVSVTIAFLQDRVVSPMLNLQVGGGGGSYLVWPLSFDLSGLGGPTRSTRLSPA